MSRTLLLMRFLVVSLLPIATQATAAEAEFPGRAIYLGTPHMEITEVNAEFDNLVIVDVRSEYEFKTLHIKDAVNVPLNSKSFIDEMQSLRDQHPQKKLVTYCNGKSCMKSYKAAAKCRNKNIENVVAYDAGIMDWAKTYPDKSVLLQETPINPADLISKKRFKQHLLTPNEFMKQANDQKSIIIDVRDPLQRAGMPLFMGIEKRATLDDTTKLKKLINEANSKNLPLYIYDETGKQVRWLMYTLEANQAKKYYFMKGGFKAYYGQLSQDFNY